eukprot:1987-Heterococcus_DN1.PRE.4
MTLLHKNFVIHTHSDESSLNRQPTDQYTLTDITYIGSQFVCSVCDTCKCSAQSMIAVSGKVSQGPATVNQQSRNDADQYQCKQRLTATYLSTHIQHAAQLHSYSQCYDDGVSLKLCTKYRFSVACADMHCHYNSTQAQRKQCSVIERYRFSEPRQLCVTLTAALAGVCANNTL